MEYDSSRDTLEHIKKVNAYLTRVVFKLLSRGLYHDSSKLTEPEKEIFDKVTPKLAQLTYGSDEYKDSLKEMGVALDHHYQDNRHHPEHHEHGIKDMNLIDLIEMLCDWKAATERHNNGDIIKSLDINQKRFNINDQLKNVLFNTVKDMGWERSQSNEQIKDR